MSIQMFETLDDLWANTAATVLHYGDDTGSRVGETRELQGFVARLANPTASFMFNPIRKMSPAYCAAETLWYLMGTFEVEFLLHYAPSYARFADMGRAFGAYGGRWAQEKGFMEALGRLYAYGERQDVNKWGTGPTLQLGKGSIGEGRSQLDTVIRILKETPESRQAVLQMWTPSDLVHALAKTQKDLPCTLNLVFSLRKGKLNCCGHMRSNDLWLGLPNDIFCFTAVQRIVAEALGVEVGWYQHSAVSMHYYKKDEEKVKAAITAMGNFSTEALTTKPTSMKVNHMVPMVMELEKWHRENGVLNGHRLPGGDHTIWGMLMLMCASKWMRDADARMELSDAVKGVSRCLAQTVLEA